jgi:amino-acid N-acetyltransferase
VLWEDLAEIRSVVVDEQRRRRGTGRQLISLLLKQARDLGVARVFALTYQQEFFERLGFKPIGKEDLPHKIWADCIDCIKFPHCDESAVILEL